MKPNKKKAAPKGKKKPLTPQDRLKLKIAKELGLFDKVKKEGWGSLSAHECGQVGGVLSRRLRDGSIDPTMLSKESATLQKSKAK